MKYIQLILIIYFLSITILQAKPVKLSENAKISVLTCSQGEELYSAFGHSAIRVNDPATKLDVVFNYGTFNFNTPNFYLKFANGKLNYMLSAADYKDFLPEYFRDSRNVTEQVLNLNLDDTQAIFDALVINYKPENRYYKYDFFFDNCATRIFDIVNDNIQGKITLSDSSAIFNGQSYRECMHYYLENSPWIETGLNIILGLPADNEPSVKQSTFLPVFLMHTLINASFKTDKNEAKNVVKEEIPLLKFEGRKDIKTRWYTKPVILFSLIVFVIITISLLDKNKSIFWRCFDGVLFLTVGIIGLLISYLWIVTDHSVTANNLNILWSFPTFIYLAFSKLESKVGNYVMRINILLLVVFIMGWSIIPQSFPYATIPISILLLFRCYIKWKKTLKLITN